jgi:hypothetical protein
VTATSMQHVMVWHGVSDASFAGELLVKGNRIRCGARGADRMACGRVSAVEDGGRTLVEGRSHLPFVGLARDQALGEILPEVPCACRNATLVHNRRRGALSGRSTPAGRA